MLPVACFMLPVICYMLHVACCMLYVASNMLHVACMLYGVCCNFIYLRKPLSVGFYLHICLGFLRLVLWNSARGPTTLPPLMSYRRVHPPVWRSTSLTASGDMVGFPCKRNEQKYVCCPNSFTDVTCTLHIRRRTMYYWINLITPCLLITGNRLRYFLAFNFEVWVSTLHP